MNFETPSTPEEKVELPKNVVEIETAGAIFRIIYNEHKVNVIELEEVGDVDALLVESGQNDYGTESEARNSLWGYASDSQYKKVFEKAQADEIPIYFGDIKTPDRDTKRNLLASILLLEAAAATVFSGLVMQDIFESKKDMSRRDFLKTTGKAMAAAYLGLPTLRAISDNVIDDKPDETAFVRKAQRFLNELEITTHPESNEIFEKLFFTFRNAIWVAKANVIADQVVQQSDLSGRKKPKIGMLAGSNHFGVEDILKDNPNERQKALSRMIKELPDSYDDLNIGLLCRAQYNKEANQVDLNYYDCDFENNKTTEIDMGE